MPAGGQAPALLAGRQEERLARRTLESGGKPYRPLEGKAVFGLTPDYDIRGQTDFFDADFAEDARSLGLTKGEIWK